MTLLPDYVEFQYRPPTPFKQLFSAASEDAIDLLSQLLKFNPSARSTASEALKHPYFTNPPAPTPPHLLPKSVKRISDMAVSPPIITASPSKTASTQQMITDSPHSSKRKLDG